MLGVIKRNCNYLTTDSLVLLHKKYGMIFGLLQFGIRTL